MPKTKIVPVTPRKPSPGEIAQGRRLARYEARRQARLKKQGVSGRAASYSVYRPGKGSYGEFKYFSGWAPENNV